MTCKHCRGAMRELRHICHHQRKWLCPRCGAVRMQRVVLRKGG